LVDHTNFEQRLDTPHNWPSRSTPPPAAIGLTATRERYRWLRSQRSPLGEAAVLEGLPHQESALGAMNLLFLAVASAGPLQVVSPLGMITS
jgi:hypothetical protein